MTSLPAPPLRPSLPSPPFKVSFPPPPSRPLFPALPTITLLRPFPKPSRPALPVKVRFSIFSRPASARSIDWALTIRSVPWPASSTDRVVAGCADDVFVVAQAAGEGSWCRRPRRANRCRRRRSPCHRRRSRDRHCRRRPRRKSLPCYPLSPVVRRRSPNRNVRRRRPPSELSPAIPCRLLLPVFPLIEFPSALPKPASRWRRQADFNHGAAIGRQVERHGGENVVVALAGGFDHFVAHAVDGGYVGAAASLVPGQVVISRLAMQGVVSGAADQNVVPIAGQQLVAPGSAVDHVVSGCAMMRSRGRCRCRRYCRPQHQSFDVGAERVV